MKKHILLISIIYAGLSTKLTEAQMVSTYTIYTSSGINSVAIDNSDNVLLTNFYGGSINRIGTTTLINSYTASSPAFFNPIGMDVDAAGNIYVADHHNNLIRKISPSGIVTTIAGSGTAGSADGMGSLATFNWPYGIVVDGSGNLFVTDEWTDIVRKITPSGLVSTFAGSVGVFSSPRGIVLDASGNLYVSDYGNNCIRKISSSGIVSLFAGSVSGTSGSSDGLGSLASFNRPSGLAIDASGNIYVSDTQNHKVRKITAAGLVSTIAGSGVSGSADGVGISAQLDSPEGMAINNSGNKLYISEQTSSTNVRVIDLSIVGINEHNKTESSIILYPNPTNGNFKIKLNSNEKQLLQVFDAVGNIVLNQSVINESTIDVSNLVNGVYTILLNNNQTNSTKKLVILK